jgi:hypothetical protein
MKRMQELQKNIREHARHQGLSGLWPETSDVTLALGCLLLAVRDSELRVVFLVLGTRFVPMAR